MTEGVLRGQQLGYYETLDAMKTGVEQGKTFTETLMGATVALGPEVLAGSAAYLAGSESGLTIASAMEQGGSSQDTAEAVGSVAGGAIGGVTASSVATGAALATSVAAGAEVGEAVGMVGGPIGMAVGAAAGVTIGAAVGGIGYLISHW